MAKEIPVQKPLLEQIFDEMFDNLEGREEFDFETIQALKQLTQSGDLKKEASVSKAIKSSLRGYYENS